MYIIFLIAVLFLQFPNGSFSQDYGGTKIPDETAEYAILGDKNRVEGNYGEAARNYQKSIDLIWNHYKFLENSDNWVDKYLFSRFADTLKFQIGYTYLYKATCRFNLEDYSGSIKDFSSAIDYLDKNSDNYPLALYNRAMAYIKLGNIGLACVDLKKAYLLDIYEAAPLIKQHCD